MSGEHLPHVYGDHVVAREVHVEVEDGEPHVGPDHDVREERRRPAVDVGVIGVVRACRTEGEDRVRPFRDPCLEEGKKQGRPRLTGHAEGIGRGVRTSGDGDDTQERNYDCEARHPFHAETAYKVGAMRRAFVVCFCVVLLCGGCTAAPRHVAPFRIERISKTQATREPDGTVVTRYGIPLQVVREDSRYFYYKVFNVTDATAAPSSPPAVSDYSVHVPSTSRVRFVPFDEGLPRTEQWRNAFAVADMNGDGAPDIVTTSPRKDPGPPRIYLGDGRGHWHRWSTATFPALDYDYGGIAVADLNGDGAPDIVEAAHLRGVFVLYGDRKGTFQGARVSPFSSQSVVVTDWNHDGHPDVVALGDGPSSPGSSQASTGLLVLLGGTKPLSIANQIFGSSLAVGRGGVIAATSVYGQRDILFPGDRVLRGLRPGAYVFAVAAHGSVVADAFTSFEGGKWRTGVDLLGKRRKLLYVEDGSSGIYGLAFGDVDGDGRSDLVALTSTGKTLVFLDEREREDIPGFRCRGIHVELADLNGDHRDEIIESFGQEPEGSHCASGGGLRVWSASTRTP